MQQTTWKDWNRKRISCGDKKLSVWPQSQEITSTKDPILLTRFDDHDCYHDVLKQRILELEKEKQYLGEYGVGGCGTKIFSIEKWGCPEANIIHQRALAFFSIAFGCKKPVSDVSMASIFRSGDYCIPHSHIRSGASIVYSLSTGDFDENNPRGGLLYFVDPRLPMCCKEEEGRMTDPVVPNMEPGTMVMFPSEIVHCVNPYTGQSPRITLAWNIHTKPIPGLPIPGGVPDS